jgi:hypothetical protein
MRLKRMQSTRIGGAAMVTGIVTEAHVDAGTGQVVSVRTETPRDQRREALESHAGE